MGGYSGDYEFDSDDDELTTLNRRQRPPLVPALPGGGAPAPFPSGGPRPMLYIKSDRLIELSRRMPINQDRPALVHSLIQAYGLLEGADMAEASLASPQEMIAFHTREYLQALAHWEQLPRRRREQHGLEDDCAPFPGLYEVAALTAGGSLAAAAALCSGRHHLAVHLDGGRHHARKAAAAGFCYVNDAVLAILRLLGSFRRVLYLDLDAHHGDGVEAAFLHTPRVLTISLHKRAPGFFPGSGAQGAGGEGAGAGFALNLPLGDGVRDGLFDAALRTLGGGAAAAFQPECVVMLCGVDGLARDPVAAAWGLTPAAYAAAATEVAGWGAPLLLLGGGGYDSPAAAAAWAGVVAALLGRQLPDEVPEHDHLHRYGPGFTLSSATKRLLPQDTSDAAAVLDACSSMVEGLRAASRMRGAAASAPGLSREAAAGAEVRPKRLMAASA